MKKVWFIEINGQSEGPFSVNDLKRDLRITPDTPAWKEGFVLWVPIRSIPELAELFKNKESPQPDESLESAARLRLLDDQLILQSSDEPPYLFWLLVAVLIITYFIFRVYLSPE